ncbi:MAG: hypothetical protein AVDCRST_MAG19-152 [uncultured Thermomicrobiales bacterium]|uniref:Uncharacterized protein n=1 Tax=uncultured Thermomicrobiales bacterium TaxID=1645740 RepID=A0A6J4UCS2_9BACT|nr:MAG: hypothetical protein AVDCRST_MAG19-152 [uncultured Thermomicrobiales bacterium]
MGRGVPSGERDAVAGNAAGPFDVSMGDGRCEASVARPPPSGSDAAIQGSPRRPHPTLGARRPRPTAGACLGCSCPAESPQTRVAMSHAIVGGTVIEAKEPSPWRHLMPLPWGDPPYPSRPPRRAGGLEG